MFALQVTHGTRQALQRSGYRRRVGGAVSRGQAVRVQAANDTAFCVDKALVLGAAAFQAYLDPLPGHGTVDRSLEGTETRFFDANYVRKHFAGVLQINGISAANLKDTDLMTESDGILRASIGDSCAVTGTAWNTLNPSWNDTLNVWVQKSEIDSPLKLQLFDDDVTKSDDPLGSVLVPTGTFPPGERVLLELPVTGAGAGAKTTLRITGTFLAFGEDGRGKADKFLEEVEDAETKLAPGAPQSVKAISAALAATIEGPDASLNDAWDTLCSTSHGVVFEEKETVAFVESHETGTQVWISKDESTKTVVVAFRGTEQDKLRDILVDINLTQAEVDLEDKPELGPSEQWWNSTRFATMRRAGVAAHAGFYHGWTSVRQRVLRCVDNCTGRDPTWKICVTGHSLGGALAVLCAFELGNRSGPSHDITMYNYGGPRVGNQAFADSYPVVDSWRVHNEDDVVAKIPVAGLLGYRHIGTGVRIAQDRQDYNFTNILGHRISPDEAKNGQSASFLEQGLGSAKDLLYKQADIIKSIASGEGITAHLEPFYLGGLACMLKNKTNDSELAQKILNLVDDNAEETVEKEDKEAVQA